MRLPNVTWTLPASHARITATFFWLAVITLAALAQSEQRLEYHSGPEPKGYRWLELSSTPPPDVALPSLKPGAWYGRWTNAVDASGGRWFCLDRSLRSGPCDRLIFDANGNGRLDDDAPVTAAHRDDYMAWFEPVKLALACEGRPMSYHLAVRIYQFDTESARLLAGSSGWYEGNVLLAGKKRRVQLFDNTVNGVFNDIGETQNACDRLAIEDEKTGTRYLGRYLEIDGQLLHLEVARDGAFLKVKPADDVAFGQVRVPESITSFTALGENGHFVRNPARGQFKLPVGGYRVTHWESTRKDDKGANWTLTGYGASSLASRFQVTSGQMADLQVGDPVYAALQITETRTELAFSLRFQGALGETVQIMRGGEQPRAPQLLVAGAGFKTTHNFEYG